MKLLQDLSMSFVSLAWCPPCLLVLHQFCCSVWKWCFCRKRFWQPFPFGSASWHLQNWFRIAVCDQALVQYNHCRPGELEMHRKWWHKCCINAPPEIQGENEGKQHVGASWGLMAVLSLWDNVGMGDKICSDGKSWYVIRISLLDSHYATKRHL